LRDQLALYNRIADWSRFHAEILYRDIEGRLIAREIEQRLIRENTKNYMVIALKGI
jgi:hypothetical protein